MEAEIKTDAPTLDTQLPPPAPLKPKGKGGRPMLPKNRAKLEARIAAQREGLPPPAEKTKGEGAPAAATPEDAPQAPRTTPAAPARRAGSRVAIGSAKDPYAQIDTCVADLRRLVEQVRREHPGSNIGDAVDPRDAAIRKLEDPMLPPEILSTALMGTYELAAEKVELPREKIPSASSFDRLAKTWAEASRYWATSASPAQVALGAALAQTAMIAAPLATAAWTKVSEQRRIRREGNQR